MRLPRSRRGFTHPMSTAFWPESEARRTPQRWVRCRSPKKSSKLCLSCGNGIPNYKWWCFDCAGCSEGKPLTTKDTKVHKGQPGKPFVNLRVLCVNELRILPG